MDPQFLSTYLTDKIAHVNFCFRRSEYLYFISHRATCELWLVTEKKCPKCGQQLRLPENIGVMLMACPSYGDKFHSDFKLGSTGRRVNWGVFATLFEMPCKIMNRIGRYFSSHIEKWSWWKSTSPPLPLQTTNLKQCPCNSGIQYSQCCQTVFSSQDRPATAEVWMRSRSFLFSVPY